MSEDPLPVSLPTSPDLNVDDGVVTSQRDFSGAMTLELQDDEIAQTVAIVLDVQSRYATKRASESNLDAMRDEILTRLAEVGVLASVDCAPILNGRPPEVEILGKVSGDPIHKYGMDHEKKEWEVKRAQIRKEDFLGQKGKHA